MSTTMPRLSTIFNEAPHFALVGYGYGFGIGTASEILVNGGADRVLIVNTMDTFRVYAPPGMLLKPF